MTSSASHTLTFSRLRASFTVDKELIGKQDPYVIFTSGNAKAQTKAIKGVGTGTAEWKETYSLDKFSPSSSSIVEVTVYNHNTLLPDNVIGSGTVDLSNQGESSLSGSGEPVSVILTDKKAQEVGTISFIVNGGGYKGRSGTSSGTGYGSSTATGAGTGYGSNTGTGSQTGYGSNTGTGSQTGYGSGSQTGYGSGSQTGYGSNSGNVVGTGVGTDKSVAQKASDAAAAQGKQVTIEEGDSLGVGHPKTTSGSNTGYTGSRSENTGSTTGYGTTGTGTTRSGTTTGVATGAVAGDKTVYGEREGDVIDRKYYVGTESRPQDQALVEQYREHNPYAKDYETTVQHTGRERLVNSQIEALGTRERLIGQDHHIHAHPHTEIARNLPAGAMAERPGGEGWVQTKVGPICDTNTFSITGDRTVDKERVTDLREHREFEKEFEVKTRLVGERALARGTEAEILNRERVLVDEKNKIACEGHPVASAAGGNTIASQQGGSYSATGATGVGAGTTGSGYNSGSTTGGTGYNSGSTTGAGYSNTGTGSGYNTSSGRGTTGQTTGEKVASYIPGSEENQAKKGNTQGTTGRPTAGEKAASFIPGTEENREKKAERQYA